MELWLCGSNNKRVSTRKNQKILTKTEGDPADFDLKKKTLLVKKGKKLHSSRLKALLQSFSAFRTAEIP